MRSFKVLLICVCSFIAISFSIHSVHAANVVHMPFNEPTKDIFHGYVVTFVEDTQNNNKLYARVVYWGLNMQIETDVLENFIPTVDVNITSTSLKITLEMAGPMVSDNFYYFGYAFNDGYYNITDSGVTGANAVYEYGNNGGRYRTVGYQIGGNVTNITESVGMGSYTVTWGESSALIDAIEKEFNSHQSFLGGLFDDLFDKIDSIFGPDTSGSSDAAAESNDVLSGSVDQYDSVESGLTDDFNSSLTDLDTDINLFNSNDFITTGTFVSDQLTNIFNSNSNISNMIMFSLIIGFSLTLIGIGVRR